MCVRDAGKGGGHPQEGWWSLRGWGWGVGRENGPSLADWPLAVMSNFVRVAAGDSRHVP